MPLDVSVISMSSSALCITNTAGTDKERIHCELKRESSHKHWFLRMHYLGTPHERHFAHSARTIMYIQLYAKGCCQINRWGNCILPQIYFGLIPKLGPKDSQIRHRLVHCSWTASNIYSPFWKSKMVTQEASDLSFVRYLSSLLLEASDLPVLRLGMYYWFK